MKVDSSIPREMHATPPQMLSGASEKVITIDA
jgi:hypothetical protein